MNLERMGLDRQGAADVSSAEHLLVSDAGSTLRVMGSPPTALMPCNGNMNRAGAKVGQASRLPSKRASESGEANLPSASPTGAGGTPALHCRSQQMVRRFTRRREL